MKFILKIPGNVDSGKNIRGFQIFLLESKLFFKSCIFKDSNRSSTCTPTCQMPATEARNTKFNPGIPHWGQGTQIPKPSSAASQGAHQQEAEQETEQGFESRYFDMGCRHMKQHPNHCATTLKTCLLLSLFFPPQTSLSHFG